MQEKATKKIQIPFLLRLELWSMCSSWMGIRQLMPSGKQGIIPGLCQEYSRDGEGGFPAFGGFGGLFCAGSRRILLGRRQLPINPDFRAQFSHLILILGSALPLNLNFRAQFYSFILILELSSSEPNLSQVCRRIQDTEIPWRQKKKNPIWLLKVAPVLVWFFFSYFF